MSILFVLDDVAPVPEEVRAMTGISRFGQLLHRKSRLSDKTLGLAERAGYAEQVHLASSADLRRLLDRLQDEPADRLCLYWPAGLAWTGEDAGVTFLRKIRFSDRNLLIEPMTPSRNHCGALLNVALLRRFLKRESSEALPDLLTANHIHAEVLASTKHLVDLSDQEAFTRYLTGQFETRYFNQIAQDRFTVTKESTDKDKIRREYNFYYLLPPRMQAIFVQPFELTEEKDTASYTMEHFSVPDVAIQWIHNAFTLEEFNSFLDKVFGFVTSRPSRMVSQEVQARVVRELYLDKLLARMDRLRRSGTFDRLSNILVTSGRCPSGMEEVIRRYETTLARLQRPGRNPHLVINHGDLCFSNMLYDKRIGLLRLIDPRGADVEDELYSDPYYDLAKLSHSVLGSYDFINNGLFRIEFGPDLNLILALDQPSQDTKRELFIKKLEECGFDYQSVRLFEASLFLSMLPLHAELPRKQLAFLLMGLQILDELDPQPSKGSALRSVLGWHRNLDGVIR